MGKVNKRARKFAKKGHLKKVKSAHQRQKQWKKRNQQERSTEKKQDGNKSNITPELIKNKDWMQQYSGFHDATNHLDIKSYGFLQNYARESLDGQALEIFKLKVGTMTSKSLTAMLRVIEEDLSVPHLKALVALMSQGDEDTDMQEEISAVCASRLSQIFEKILLQDVEGVGPKRFAKMKKRAEWKDVGGTLQDFLHALVTEAWVDSKPVLGPTFVLGLFHPFPSLACAVAAAAAKRGGEAVSTEKAGEWVDLVVGLARVLSVPVLDHCFKVLYLSYMKLAAKISTSNKEVSSSKLSIKEQILQIYMRGLCSIAELHTGSGYLHIYVYFEGCARQILEKKIFKTSDYPFCQKRIYELKVLADVMCANVENEHFRSMLPLLLQVVLDFSNKCPANSNLLELRLDCVRILHQVCKAGKYFCPSASLILSVLTHTVLWPKIGVIEKAFDLLKVDVEVFKSSPGFAEYGLLMIQELESLRDLEEMSNWNAKIRSLCDAVMKYTAKLNVTHNQLGIAPKDSVLC
mmetsp:Transcript_11948/g.15067  ORF Transcript_11948/g.15067 Transcript_11948/m.15067 type:complete len:519 (+) Transcript_11948:47-1603(+)